MNLFKKLTGLLIFILALGITSSQAQQGANAVLQAAAVANGNGTEFLVAGNSGTILTVNCSACGGGTTVNFEASEDGTNYVSVSALQVGTTTNATSTATSGITVWQVSLSGMVKFRARISAYSAGTITVSGHAFPVANGPTVISAGSGTSANQVQGTAATGAAVVGNPVLAGGKDTSGNAQPISTNTSGVLNIITNNGAADAFGNGSAGFLGGTSGSSLSLTVDALGFNGTAWDRLRNASLANFPTSQTTTAVNSIGAQIVEKGSRWTKTSAPAAGSAASASIAAEASVRHSLDCVGWSADSSGAVTAANTVITVRDGATGAGTVLWQWVVSFPTAGALGVQELQPTNFCGLNIVGTTNTAMTVEFGAGVANSLQAINMTGFNVN